MFGVFRRSCVTREWPFIDMTYTQQILTHRLPSFRNNQFKEDEGAWKGEGDGKVVNNQPQRVMMDGQQMIPSGYIGRFDQTLLCWDHVEWDDSLKNR